MTIVATKGVTKGAKTAPPTRWRPGIRASSSTARAGATSPQPAGERGGAERLRVRAAGSENGVEGSTDRSRSILRAAPARFIGRLTTRASNGARDVPMMSHFPSVTEKTGLTFLNLGSPTGLKFVVDHGSSRAMFEMGVEHSPGAVPFSLGLEPRSGRELLDLVAVRMAPARPPGPRPWDR